MVMLVDTQDAYASPSINTEGLVPPMFGDFFSDYTPEGIPSGSSGMSMVATGGGGGGGIPLSNSSPAPTVPPTTGAPTTAGGGTASSTGLGGWGVAGPVASGGTAEGGFLGNLVKGMTTKDWVGLGLNVAGGIVDYNAAGRASDAAVAGSQAERDLIEKWMNVARDDQKPYRLAGYKALDALMSLTGLGGSGDASNAGNYGNAVRPQQYAPAIRSASDQVNVRQSAYQEPSLGRATGGPMGGGNYYNINELGPESVYSGGSYTRNPNPMTIDGQTGYVEPNIQGRALGGPMQNRDIKYGGVGWGGPQQQLPMDVQPPPRPPATPVQPGNQANSTAINPQTGYPNENPGGVEGGYNFMTEPGYQFRFSEGQRALERGAAARGGLLSGGYARKAIRYGQGFASNEFSNVYNRISNIAGLGQTANQQSGQYAMYGGAGMGAAAGAQGINSAYGHIAQGNAIGSTVANLPWDNWFGGNS